MNIRFRTFFDPQPFDAIYERMRHFTHERHGGTPDEIWFLEHAPVFTQGQAGLPEHLLCANEIPVIQTDRGGQITYHGPGQLMSYCLIDLKRRNIGVRGFVTALENIYIALLKDYGLEATARRDAPGVYLKSGEKIASIGLRIRKGCSYHGVSFNLNMDLGPFSQINPCGFKSLKMTQLKSHVPDIKRSIIETKLQRLFNEYLSPQQVPCREYDV